MIPFRSPNFNTFHPAAVRSNFPTPVNAEFRTSFLTILTCKAYIIDQKSPSHAHNLHVDSHESLAKSEMETKNLKGLFNLTRKEFKDVRERIQALEEAVGVLSGAVNDSGLRVGDERDRDEVLGCLGRIEGLLRGRTEVAMPKSQGNALRIKESALLRSLLQDPGDANAASDIQESDAVTQDEQSTDRKSFTPDGSEVSSSIVQQTLPEPKDPALMARSRQIAREIPRSSETLPENGQDVPSPTENSCACDRKVDQRLDEMSSQIDNLLEVQREMMAVLKNLVEKDSKSTRSPVVVPPPRKVGRKVVGFVYDDDGSDP